MRTFLFGIFILWLALAAGSTATAQADAIAIVRQRLSDHLIQTLDSTDAATHLKNQQPDGSWKDVDYTDRSRVDWKPDAHLRRMTAMAAAFRTPGGTHDGDKSMLDGVRRALEFWNSASPRGHIWRNNLGMPGQLAPVLVLMQGHIDDDLRDRVLQGHMSHLMTVEAKKGKGKHSAGADFVRNMVLRIQIGAVSLKPELISEGSKGIQSVARMGDPGLQPDGSYHYHGPQIYYPSYSSQHFESTAVWGDIFRDTPWELDAEATAFLRDGILNGFRWVIRGKSYDPFVRGRMISRNTQGGPEVITSPVVRLDWVKRMLRVDPANAPQYQAMLDHVSGKRASAVVGNRHFWRSDYMTHHRDAFMLSVRMMSTRTSIQETGNDENTRNRWLTQGATAILVRGDEYDQIFPLWEWRRIPGTTAPVSGGTRAGQSVGKWGSTGFTDFVGGASDGMFGVAAMDMDWHDGSEKKGKEEARQPRITAKKNWFFFDREMVALGSDIRYSGELGPVQTTLNQTERKSPVFSSRNPGGSGEPDTAGETISSVDWFWQDDVGYFFPSPQKVLLKSESGITGGWGSINGGYNETHTETRDRFTLSIDHGDKPEGESYAYIVVPGLAQTELNAYLQQNQLVIVANNEKVAAVHHKGQQLSGVVIRDPKTGPVKVHENLQVSTDAPVILLIDESTTPARITAGSPTATAVRIALRHQGRDYDLDFQLPGTRSVTLTVDGKVVE